MSIETPAVMMQVKTGTLTPARIQYPPGAILIPLVLGTLVLLFPSIIVAMRESLAAWATVACVVALVVLGYRQSRLMGDNPWVSPLFIHMLYVFVLQYGVGLLFIEYGQLALDYMEWDPVGFLDLRSAVPRSSWLIIVGALGTFAGLSFRMSAATRHLPRLVWDEDARRFPFRALFLFPLVFGAYAYSVSDEALGEIQQTAYIIGMFGMVLLVCGLVRLKRGTRHPAVWRSVIAGAVLGYVAVGFVFAARGIWLLIVIFFVWSTLAIRGTLSWKWVAGLTAGLILFSVLVFPWLSLYKYHRKGGLLPMREAIEWTNESYHEAFGELKLDGMIEFLRSLTYQATYVASYQRTTPDPHAYLWGESAMVVLSTIVPRFLNPRKANVLEYVQNLAYQAGLYTDATYYGGEQRGAIAIDYVSEFYINFGPWGVLVLSILQGMFLRLRYEWLIRRSDLAFGFPMYAVGFLSASSLWQMFVLDIKNWFIWTLLLWFCSRRMAR